MADFEEPLTPETFPRGTPWGNVSLGAGYWLREAIRLVEKGGTDRRLEIAVRMAHLEYLRASLEIQTQRDLGGDVGTNGDP